jgi:hypothetical protein
MSINDIILEKVIDVSQTVGNINARLDNIEVDIAELKKKKPWTKSVDWIRVGKGAGYIILSIAVAGGGVAGVSTWFGFFK